MFSPLPGQTNLIQHHIETEPGVVVHSWPYCLAEHKKKVVRSELEVMLEIGVIEESQSDWTSPIVLVPKMDGSVWFCVDYHKKNLPSPRCLDYTNLLRYLLGCSGHRLLADESGSVSDQIWGIPQEFIMARYYRIQPFSCSVTCLRPKAKKEVRQLLGLAGFYRRFVPNYLDLTSPLTDLTKNPDRCIGQGAWSLLSQEIEGEERPVLYMGICEGVTTAMNI
ncbi:Transposon Ty3-I Gag-Pol polyprotein [Labeo rohita]|uniref:Transposon Ty3-I Gag-Pol polyprotein n=1 Tax=Labeo rohita TaxID=84645 RepID=A0ABQ8L9W3_LABRO|nr:Transposon Ty3-I Gag-Pol polyprotein [Labeo rohita]